MYKRSERALRTADFPMSCISCHRRYTCFFFFSSRRRHTRYWRDWSSDVCSSDLQVGPGARRAGLVAVILGRQIAFGADAGADDETLPGADEIVVVGLDADRRGAELPTLERARAVRDLGAAAEVRHTDPESDGEAAEGDLARVVPHLHVPRAEARVTPAGTDVAAERVVAPRGTDGDAGRDDALRLDREDVERDAQRIQPDHPNERPLVEWASAVLRVSRRGDDCRNGSGDDERPDGLAVDHSRLLMSGHGHHDGATRVTPRARRSDSLGAPIG